MDSNDTSALFAEFLSFFPKADLPLTIQYSDHHIFTKSNDPLPDRLLQQFVFPNLDFEIDEFTEFLPCLKFDSSLKMHHLIIWSARLLHYSFSLMNFNQQGVFLDMSEIAGFYSEKNELIQKMAHVDGDANIYIVEGNIAENQLEVLPEKTMKWQVQILPDGEIETIPMLI
jgi:hypothetical protein